MAAALDKEIVVDVTPDLLAHASERVAHYFLWRWLRRSEYVIWPYFRGAPRVIHYFFPENTLRRAHRWKNGHRLLVTMHQPPDHMELMMRDPHYDELMRGIRAADGIVVQSTTHLDAFRNLFPGIPVSYIPLGVATDHYRRRIPAPAHGPTAPRILTVGSWLRDYALWADTVRRLAGHHPAPQFRVVANPGVIAEARRYLGATSADVVFLNGLSDDALMREYEEASVFYLPLTDAMANDALLEAMAMETPMVVTDLTATRDYAGDDGALFIPRGDQPAASAAVTCLLQDLGAGAVLAAAGRRRAETTFNWPVIVGRYRDLYRELMTRPARPA